MADRFTDPKVGDPVAYYSAHSRGPRPTSRQVIERVTATQIIIGGDKFRRETGYKITSDRYGVSNIVPWDAALDERLAALDIEEANAKFLWTRRWMRGAGCRASGPRRCSCGRPLRRACGDWCSRMWPLGWAACYHSGMGVAETKAHKRSVRGVTTATLDASNLAAGGVIVLCVSDVLTKNDRYVRTKHGTAESSLSKAYKAAVARAALGAGFVAPIKVAASKLLKTKASAIYGECTITEGLWSLEVLSIWPTARPGLKDTGATAIANGDSDAPLSMVRDAMQRAGIIDDDMRIVSDRTFSMYIKDERRTVARLSRLNNLDGAFFRDNIKMLLRDEEKARQQTEKP